VKTRRFGSPKYVGDPLNAIRIFNEKEVDELMVLDIDASREGREPDYRLIEQIAGECFMPLCYGGGIWRGDQADRIFSLGVEKVAVQTAALSHPSILSNIARKWGRQAVVASIDVKRDWLGRRRLFSAASRKIVGDWRTQLKTVTEAGAGEILLNSVDHEGLMEGPDLELVREAAKAVAVPLIATGGVGSLAHIKAAVEAGADAVAAGSYFVFHGPHRAVLVTYPAYSDLAALLGHQP
jgi:imidazole glycerol-phosphate synthase subunit HisF